MKKLRFHKLFITITLIVGITLMLVSCGPTYVRSGYGYNNGYGYNRPNYGYSYGYPRPYRYSPPTVIVPRYYPSPRRGYGGGYGRGRRW